VLVADLGELGTGRADPELVAYELQEWFAGVLAQLPPARREALELSAEGLTPTEIARQVGKTPEAVRTALKLGRKQAVAMWQAVPSQRGRTPEPATEPQSAAPRSTEDSPVDGPSAAAGSGGGSQRDSGAGNGPRPESEGGRS
jgi:hypothetical protein